VLIYDGQCGFCMIWIRYWQRLTGDKIEYRPSQECRQEYPEIPEREFSRSVQLVTPEGEVLSGAWAVFTTLKDVPGKGWMLWAYEHVPGVESLTETGYGIVAANRGFFYHATRLLFGREIVPLTYQNVQWLFLKLLAVIYLIAFLSFGSQAMGLIGSKGILPAESLLWWKASDEAIRATWMTGALVSLVLMTGYFRRVCLAVLYLSYLSLSAAGQEFMSFQWDALLLESGFLAMFLGDSVITVWLFRWLAFRLMFLSGAVKLLSRDETWRNLTALQYHYMTQPLPNPVAWYAYQLPVWFQRASTAATLFTELVMPFLIFTPRRTRYIGAGVLVGLQVLILLTGNYTFFNLLAISLCLFLLDDGCVRLPFTVRPMRGPVRWLLAPCAVVLAIAGGLVIWERTVGESPATALAEPFERYQVVNGYGLFAVMTTSRLEILIQGSDDGETWRDYEFKYKPGDLRRAPPWVAPLQPRLDWQMWFAALGSYRSSPWIISLLYRLLEGATPVAELLERNPFPDRPPKYVRALASRYDFTDFAERRRNGNWWKREPPLIYVRAITRENFARHPGQ